jgi:hypothetical protein
MTSENGMPATRVHDFVMHLETQPGHDAKYTNHRLIAALFECWEHRKQYVGVKLFECGRGCCATTTLIEFAKWINAPTLVISNNWQYWKKTGIDARSWQASIRGMQPRPELVLMDSPANCDVFRSVVMTAKFDHWLQTFPYPAFFADQRKSQCA